MTDSVRRFSHSRVAAGAVLALLAGAASGANVQADAQLAELQALRAQLAAMNERLQELEAQVQAASVASSPDEVRTMHTSAAAPNKVGFTGDVRLRSESIDEEGLERRDRNRVRARAGVTAQVTESVTAGARIASGGRDPRTTNATLTGENAKKEVGLDLAYLQWRMRPDMKATAGKMENPLWRPRSSLFHSADVMPEGWVVDYGAASGWFGGLMQFWLEERAADEDSMLYLGQFGRRIQMEQGRRLTLAAYYADYQEVEGGKPYYDGVSAYGNSVLSDGSLANDFNVLGAAAEWDATLLLHPVSVFAEFARNTAASEYNLAAALGASFGDASQPRGWQVAYQYQWLEKDALFAQTINGDFNNGLTDGRGHAIKFAYGLAKSWSVSFTLMLSELNMDVGARHDVSRAQIDLHAKY